MLNKGILMLSLEALILSYPPVCLCSETSTQREEQHNTAATPPFLDIVHVRRVILPSINSFFLFATNIAAGCKSANPAVGKANQARLHLRSWTLYNNSALLLSISDYQQRTTQTKKNSNLNARHLNENN